MSGPVDLAVVGNGRVAALINSHGRLVWWCFPRFDSDPVFCRLIAGDEEKGFCDVLLDRQVDAKSQYERNTATVVTILTADDGAQVKITDFAPRLRRSRDCRASPCVSAPRNFTAIPSGARWRGPAISPMASRPWCG